MSKYVLTQKVVFDQQEDKVLKFNLVLHLSFILYAFSLSLCLYCVSDANECEDNLHNCSNKAICLDMIGSYYCGCFSGYHGDGIICSSKFVCILL